MADREKVIYDIERCICHVPDACKDCSKYGGDNAIRCMEELLTDALSLLKKQEPVEPERAHSGGGSTWWNVCGSCKTAINPNDKFCHECGRAVKWDG